MHKSVFEKVQKHRIENTILESSSTLFVKSLKVAQYCAKSRMHCWTWISSLQINIVDRELKNEAWIQRVSTKITHFSRISAEILKFCMIRMHLVILNCFISVDARGRIWTRKLYNMKLSQIGDIPKTHRKMWHMREINPIYFVWSLIPIYDFLAIKKRVFSGSTFSCFFVFFSEIKFLQ